MQNKFFIFPGNQVGLVTKAVMVSGAAQLPLNPGNWLRPMSMPIPEDEVEAEIVRQMLKDVSLVYDESPHDLAR